MEVFRLSRRWFLQILVLWMMTSCSFVCGYLTFNNLEGWRGEVSSRVGYIGTSQGECPFTPSHPSPALFNPDDGDSMFSRTTHNRSVTNKKTRFEIEICPELKFLMSLCSSLQTEVTLWTRMRDVLGLNLGVPAILT
jgi:hypothetical protein